MRNKMFQINLTIGIHKVYVRLSNEDLINGYHVLMEHTLKRFYFADKLFRYAVLTFANEYLF